ncbi:MAG: heparinase II/III-family protein [Acetobacteraceae bacterium]
MEGGFQRLQAGRTVLLVDCGRPPPPGVDRLSHAGTLSMELSIGRERLIVNCGAAPASGAPWRDASRATAAHSHAGDRRHQQLGAARARARPPAGACRDAAAGGERRALAGGEP